MAATPKKIYLSDESLATIGPEAMGSLAGRVNTIISRYESIVRDGPALTWAEWEHILHALNGHHLLDEQADAWRHAWASIADTPAVVDSAVDPQALAAKVRALPAAAQIAICELVARWWTDEQETGDAELLSRVGGRIAP